MGTGSKSGLVISVEVQAEVFQTCDDKKSMEQLRDVSNLETPTRATALTSNRRKVTLT